MSKVKTIQISQPLKEIASLKSIADQLFSEMNSIASENAIDVMIARMTEEKRTIDSSVQELTQKLNTQTSALKALKNIAKTDRKTAEEEIKADIKILATKHGAIKNSRAELSEKLKMLEAIKNGNSASYLEIFTRDLASDAKVDEASKNTRIEKVKYLFGQDKTTENLGKVLFGLSFESKISDQEHEAKMERMKTSFTTINKKYGYFNTQGAFDAAFASYIDSYKAGEYGAYVMDLIVPNEIDEKAYKMLVIFDDITKLETFIASKMPHAANGFHDALQYTLPVSSHENKPIDIAKWKILIQQQGVYILQNFSFAGQIETLHKGVPKDKTEFTNILSGIFYKNASEDPKLAALCKNYNVDETTFNQILALRKTGILFDKKSDKLPDIIVDCSTLADDGGLGKKVSKDNHYMVKLPKSDSRGLILGNITDCCQSIGGDSEKCVIDGMTLDNNGFYVLIEGKKGFDPKNINWDSLEADGHKIVGQGYCWRGKEGGLTFDSWENLQSTSNDEMVRQMLKSFAEQAMKSDAEISRVTIGKGGKTPAYIKKMPKAGAESMFEGFSYGDAKNQAEITVSKEILEARDALALKTGIEDQSHIISIEHAKLLAELPLMQNNDARKFTLLFSKGAITIYTNFGIKFSELSAIDDVQKIEALTSPLALVAYKNGIEFEKLSKFDDINKIKALTSSDARYSYENGIEFDQLSKFDDVQKIEALISYTTMAAYKNGIEFEKLSKFDASKIVALTDYNARYAYEKGVEFEQLAKFDAEKIKALASFALVFSNEREACEKFGITFDRLSHVDDGKKINTLTSYNARYAYEKQWITFDRLAHVDDVQKIEALTSELAIKAYENGVEFDQLSAIDDVQKIEALTSRWAVVAYKNGVEFDQLSAIDDVQKIKALTSKEVRYMYIDMSIDFQTLKNCTLDVIILLTSEKAQNIYNSTPVTSKQMLDIAQKFSISELTLVIDIINSNDSALTDSKAGIVKLVLDDLSKVLGIDLTEKAVTMTKLYKFIEYENTHRNESLLTQEMMDHLKNCMHAVDQEHKEMIGEIENFHHLS